MRHLQLLADDQTLFILTGNGQMALWDTATNQRRMTFQGTDNTLAFARLTTDQRFVTGARLGGRGALWDATTGQLAGPEILASPMGHWIWFSPDGLHAATGSEGGILQFWNARTGHRAGPVLQQAGYIAPLAKAFSPDGRKFAAAGDGVVRVWDAVRHERLFDLPPLAPPIEFVCFSPNGLWLFVTAGDNAVHRFSTVNGAALLPPFRHDRRITSVYIRDDSQLAISCSDDGAVRYWHPVTGEALGQSPRHTDWVNSVGISSHMRYVVTTSGDKTARVWDHTGRPISQPLQHREQPAAAVFSRDGKSIFAQFEQARATARTDPGAAAYAELARWFFPSINP